MSDRKTFVLFCLTCATLGAYGVRLRLHSGDHHALPNRSAKHVCMVSSNAPDGHKRSKSDFQELFKQCVLDQPETQVVVLALQDYKNDISPNSVLAEGRDGMFKKQFDLVGKELLSEKVGHGMFCRKVGMLKSMGASFTSCGGPALLIYTAGEAVELSRVDRRHGSDTDTTRKGSLSMVMKFNGHQIVVASTHGEEGVRGKARSSKCPSKTYDKGIAAEELRVRDFREGLASIRGSLGEGDGVLWGGDFNPRTQSPTNGCPIWPKLLPVESASLDIPKPSQETIDAMLQPLLEGRDIIGAAPGSKGEVLASFTAELEQSGLPIEEVPGVKCPTYKKAARPHPNVMDVDGIDYESPQDAAQCADSEEDNTMFYLTEKPMAWTDRIFSSSQRATPWLMCNGVQRVTHQSDHDAVVTTCAVV